MVDEINKDELQQNDENAPEDQSQPESLFIAVGVELPSGFGAGA